jgi:DNA-binding transcriptional MerR regulator
LAADVGVYGIAVAAELTGVNPPMLRAYESKGLLQPARTAGGTRRYSRADLDQVKRITTLLASGLNLAGVAQVLELEAETARLRTEIEALRAQLSEPDTAAPNTGGDPPCPPST